MKIQCPGCHSSLTLEAQLIGQKVRCTSCNTDFTVQNPNLMPCPDCFALISKRAAVCPRCGAPQTQNCGVDSTAEEKKILVCHPGTMNFLWEIIGGIITIPIIVGIFILLYVWIEIHFTTYIITNLRIIVKRGWLAKTQNEIWIKDMRSVNLLQGLWQRIIGLGDIEIGTAATAGTEICISGVSEPQKVIDTINSLRH